MEGTIRTFDEAKRDEIHAHVKRIAEMIAAAGGAKAKVTIIPGYPITFNDPKLTEKSLPTLRRVAGNDGVQVIANPWRRGFLLLSEEGARPLLLPRHPPKNQTAQEAASNHSPLFYVDESGLPLGVRALSHLTVDYLSGH